MPRGRAPEGFPLTPTNAGPQIGLCPVFPGVREADGADARFPPARARGRADLPTGSARWPRSRWKNLCAKTPTEVRSHGSCRATVNPSRPARAYERTTREPEAPRRFARLLLTRPDNLRDKDIGPCGNSLPSALR
ncbi:hypothetical protein GCM10010415_31050 [Streptomyces atrovirens]